MMARLLLDVIFRDSFLVHIPRMTYFSYIKTGREVQKNIIHPLQKLQKLLGMYIGVADIWW